MGPYDGSAGSLPDHYDGLMKTLFLMVLLSQNGAGGYQRLLRQYRDTGAVPGKAESDSGDLLNGQVAGPG